VEQSTLAGDEAVAVVAVTAATGTVVGMAAAVAAGFAVDVAATVAAATGAEVCVACAAAFGAAVVAGVFVAPQALNASIAMRERVINFIFIRVIVEGAGMKTVGEI